MNGIINLLKPPGVSSARVINRIKKRWDWKKVGHTGTLDPLAAGVLPICVGKATKVASLIILEDKTYWGEIRLGQERDTDDAYGKVINQFPINCSKEDVIRELKKFSGEIFQTPPQVSAVKVEGERAYRRTRRGEEFKISSRRVNIFSLNPLEIDLPRVRFWIHCSKGTYIRSIARDLGRALGVGGYLSFLIRTSTGPFKIKDSFSLEEMEKMGPEGFLLNPDYALQHLPLLITGDEGRQKVIFGQPLTIDELSKVPRDKGEVYRLYDQGGTFLALCRAGEDGYHPFKVFI